MKIHEYEAKAILAGYDIPIPRGRVASAPEQVAQIARDLGTKVVVKAQVHVGGRGKAGGVKVADTPETAREVGSAILGMNIKGLTVEKVLVEEALDIQKEYYIGITIDRSEKKNVLMVSPMGGMDIEEVAITTPDKIAKAHIDPLNGLTDYQINQACYYSGLDLSKINEVKNFIKGLYKAYLDIDASLAEINPLVVTGDGTIIAADAKINIDDNALFRHPDYSKYRSNGEEDPIEREARIRGLQYVKLEGDIGIIGNGAGLVMATLDEVKRAGGTPANFLDIGGGAKADVVRNAFEIVMMNHKVRGVFINVFGGITRCDEVIKGIIEAVSAVNTNIPMVVRLTGTNEEEGRRILSDTSLVAVNSMKDGADKIVQLVGGSK